MTHFKVLDIIARILKWVTLLYKKIPCIILLKI